jgi:hypothetical protein
VLYRVWQSFQAADHGDISAQQMPYASTKIKWRNNAAESGESEFAQPCMNRL